MISIIVPAYNEQDNVRIYDKELIPYIKELKKPYELIIVDDGSKDNTKIEAEKLSKFNKNIRVVSYFPNGGMGCAIKKGIEASKGDTLIVLDSDLTFHPKFIKDLIDEYEKTDADCVIGSHLLAHDGLENKNFIRIFLHKGVNTIYLILFNGKVKTMSSIFRLYKASSLKDMKIESNGFDINAEILFKLVRNNKRIREVPAILGTRRYGVSKINLKKEFINHLKLISKIIRWKLFG
ncbi:MAG TPA: glycosyltransferase [Candidatus Nanoarchaeia archaeon]|nr:glycosyltransferase [Candidatus Nanoarchaeia archaeon]